METLVRDVRYATRRLRKTPGFTLIALLSIALGVGANTAIFSLIDAVVLRRPPVAELHRLYEVYIRQEGFPYSPTSYPDYRDIRDETKTVFEGVSGSKLSLTQRDLGDRFESVPVELVTGNYFQLLGLAAERGRLFTPEDDVVKGGHPLVVLSYEYWQGSFAGDNAAIGSEIRLNGLPYTIVGVAPRRYAGNLRGLAPSVYVPIQMSNQIEGEEFDGLEARGNRGVFVKARLANGVAREAADAALAALTTKLQQEHPEQFAANSALFVVPSEDVIINPSVDKVVLPAAGVLMGVVGLVLLVACANLASFLLAQASGRRREVAIRLALGARRGVLVRQLLTETLLLALAGGALGVLVGVLLMRALLGIDLPLPLPITLDVGLNPTVLGFALAASVSAGVLFGLAPALQATKPGVASTLKNEATGGGKPRRVTLRNALVVGQVAMSLVLLVTGALFLRSFQARQRVDVGFGDAPTATLWIGIPGDRLPEASGRALLRELLDRIARLPGVTAVGLTGNLHLNPLSTNMTGINVDGHSPPPGQQYFAIDVAPVDTGFFAAAGIRIVSGRNFNATDVAGGPRAVIINQVMAERFWPGQDAVGRTIRTGDEEVRVVGVVSNAKIRTIGEPPRPFIYGSFAQDYSASVFVLARTTGSAELTVQQAQQVLREVNRNLVVFQARTMERHLGAMLLPARLGALTISAFAALALVLAVIGLYGIVSYAVARRSREVGIRMALGAEPGRVVRLLMTGGLQLVVIGGATGLLLALAGTRILRGLLFGIGALDPVTFAVVPVVLLGVALLATWLPARRATRVDPVRALRSD
jgi:predicted permease